MEFEEISERAFKKNGPEKFYDLPKIYAYYCLEDLYYKYKLGNISKEKSIIEKQKIKKEYEDNKRIYERALEIQKEYNDNRIQNELLLDELEKSKNKDEIIEYALKIIANNIKDDSFIERNLNKLK